MLHEAFAVLRRLEVQAEVRRKCSALSVLRQTSEKLLQQLNILLSFSLYIHFTDKQEWSYNKTVGKGKDMVKKVGPSHTTLFASMLYFLLLA